MLNNYQVSHLKKNTISVQHSLMDTDKKWRKLAPIQWLWAVLVITQHHLTLKTKCCMWLRDRHGDIGQTHSINHLYHISSNHFIPWQSLHCMPFLLKSFHPKQQGWGKQMGGVMGETALFPLLQWRRKQTPTAFHNLPAVLGLTV